MNRLSFAYNKFWISTLLIMVVVAVAFAVPNFLYLVEGLGYRIPQEDVQTDYVIGVVWAMMLGVSILAWPVSSRDKRCLLLVWLVKVLISLSVMLFFESQQPLDSYGYYDVSRRDSLFLWEDKFWYGSYNIARIAWLHHCFLPDSFHALKITFAMVGLIAVYLFYRAAVLFMEREDRRVFYALSFFPSLLFLSSTISKEPVILFAVAMYVYGVVGWHRTKRLRYFVIIVLGLTLVTMVRYWMCIVMIVPLMFLLFLSMRGFVVRTILIISMLVTCLLMTHRMHGNYFQLNTKQDLIAKLNVYSKNFSIGRTGLEASGEFNGIGSIIAYVPKGSFTALFRPLPGEVLNSFGQLAGIENMILLILLLLSLIRIYHHWRELQDPLVIWAILLLLTWSTLYGFVSYNLGTMVRYKIQILPVLLGLLLYLARTRRA